MSVSQGSLTAAVAWAAILWIGAIAAIVTWKLFTGAIDLRGLLQGDRADGGTYFSPGRAQLLVVTTLFSVHLVMQVMGQPSQFPKIPHELLAVLGGSQAAYLVGKARAMLG